MNGAGSFRQILPNKPLPPTAYSLPSCVAKASSSG